MNAALSSWVLPLATGVLVTVFTVLLFMQWRARKRPHQLWWTIGFAMYAASAYMEFAALVSGSWNPLLYRVYVIVTAVLVPVLAQGTIDLIARRKVWARAYLTYNAVVALVFAVGVFTTPLLPAKLAKASIASYAALGGTAFTYPRVLSMALTIPAALVLFGGAIVSILRFMRRKEYAYRVWANVLIAVATLVISSGGALAKAGNTTGFYLSEMLAAILYFAGFLLAGTLQKGADAVRSHRR